MRRCHYCDKEALFLCDAPAITAPPRVTGLAEPCCSRPICKDHRIVRGGGIVTFARKQQGRRSERFTIDWCPDCAATVGTEGVAMYPHTDHTDLDNFGKEAEARHAFAAGLESIADGDHDCLFEAAEITQRGDHKVVRCDITFTALGRTIEHIYWLNNQNNVNSFLAEMAALGHAATTWGSGPGKIPLSQAIPACVASLANTRFRATKTTRVTPAQPAKYGQPPREAKTYRDLRIQCRLTGAPMPVGGSLPSVQADGTLPGGYANSEVPF